MGCGASSGTSKSTVKKLTLNKPTKIPSFDEVFNAMQAPSDTVFTLGSNFDTVVENLQALPEIPLFKTKLKGADGKIIKDPAKIVKVVFDDLRAAKITIEFKYDADSNTIKLEAKLDDSQVDLKKAFDMIKAICDAIIEVVKAVPDLIKQVGDLVGKCADFPEKAKGEAEGAGLGGMDAVKAVSNCASNCKASAELPNNCKALLDSAKALLDAIKTAATDAAGAV
mmetsp:Transcript_20837/g.29349  ORF Transcript_20837/g.29349 Transcript_20837/m.29349 type:complete len:225 (-) Transcript_20837:101-775(-)|eukprot:CAMPEP_0175097202 /NCGR_PEP_ID=MMETSP0086_2-20121207/5157_1 /TAXON_ID=136419 /ORGANISM="Unknown Unknown, Strain D1" /LENGTH=224 /DNA_ID=CAMNT_0016370689 /DNA_START=41 /DNA_END=715 /DNA_ORIENTATION=+